ncbi:MAG: metal-dependent hydrolase [Candidatus Hermodarchaeota archaeon]
MDFFTHVVFGALMYTLILKEITFNYFLYAMFFAFLPDLDIFISPLKRVFKSNYFEHRSGSHSFFIGIVLSTIISSIYSVLKQQPFLILWIISIIFYGIHVSLDLLNTTKIPCFYPISKKEYCFSVEKAGSSFTFLTSWIFIVSLLIVYHFFPDNTLLLFVINTYTYFILAYYFFRILTKIWVNSHLKENQKYFPGVLPLYFFIYEKEILNDNILLRVEKRSHFKKTKVIYENSEKLTEKEMILFKKGLELCMENYYYSKWTVLPKILRSNDIISIRFFFLEPMIHSRAHYIQFDFDMKSENLKGYNQSFGSIKVDIV